MRLPCFICLLLFFTSISAKPNGHCNTEKEITKFSTWVNNINNYNIVLNVQIPENTTSVNSTLSGITGKRLRIELSSSTDKYTSTQIAIYDGKYQWVESKNPLGTQVVKLETKKLIKADRPFDTSFYLMGAGLINGEDFPTTLKTILAVYDFNEPCKKNENITLIGKINKNNFTNYIEKSRYAENKLQTIDKYIKTFGHVTLKLNDRTQELAQYSFGTKNKKEITYIILNSYINHPIPEKNFIYHPQEKIEIIDITQDVLNTHNN